MKLIKCHIENFGKFSNASFDFKEGLNVFCEDNGWGKSTLSAFIKVMFYGFDGETKKKLVEKEREIYRPWQGGVYGGQVTFEVAGHTYIMLRIFGKKESEDEFILKDAGTNIVSETYSSKIGEEIFKIDAESFKRTIYISQNDCEATTTDSINAKIGNLAENTDDINNYENVDNRLKDILNSMSPRRATGSLNKLKKNIAELTEYVKEAESVDKSIEEVTSLREEGRNKLESLKSKRDELSGIQKQLSEYKDIQVKKERYIALTNEYNTRRAEYEKEQTYFSNGIPEEKNIKDAMDRASKLEGLNHTVSLYEPTAEERIKYDNNYRVEFEDKDIIEKDIQHIISIAKIRNEKKTMLNTKKMELSTRKTMLVNNTNNANKNVFGMILFILACVFVFVGLALVVATPLPKLIAFALILVGIVCGVSGFVMKNNKNGKKDDVQKDEDIIRLEEEIESEEEYILNVGNEIKEFFDRYALIYNEDDVATELYELRNLIKDCMLIHEKIFKYNNAKEIYEKERDEVHTFIRNLGFSVSANVREQLREIYDRYHKVIACKQELTKAGNAKAEFEKKEEVSNLNKDISIPDNVSVEEITNKLNQIQLEIEVLNENISSYNKTLDDYRLKRDEISEKEVELEVRKREYDEDKKKYDLLEKTKELLGQAKVSFTARYMQPIMSGFEKYYGIIAGSNADAFDIDANTELSVNELGMPRSITSLSTGYQDLIGVCMRMALVDAMYKDEKPFIIFDDPFVNLDEDKIKGGVEALKNIACEYQMIYFTCHNSRI